MSLQARAGWLSLLLWCGACGGDDGPPGAVVPGLDAGADACEGMACHDASADACTGSACAADARANDACMGAACLDADLPDAQADAACTGVCVARLLSLAITPGALSPSFDASVARYGARVGVFVERVQITANVGEDTTITINGDRVTSGVSWQSPVLAIGPNTIEVVLSAPGVLSGSYVLTVERGYQEAYVKASNTSQVMEGTGIGDEFGTSVALDGDTLVVGAPQEASAATGINGNQNNDSAQGAGAVYVFVRSGSTWSQQAYLKASNAEVGDAFGTSVAIDGDTLVVGAPLEASIATGVNGDQTNNEHTAAGAAYVFVRSGSTWSQQAYLKASNAGVADLFGTDVDISAHTVVIGAPQESSSTTSINGPDNDDAMRAGAAYVFVRSGNAWSQQAYLKANNADAQDRFGEDVAIDGDSVVVGAIGEASGGVSPNDESEPFAGAAYVFVRSGSTWSQEARLKSNVARSQDRFGNAVDISGALIVVGASNEASAARGIDGDETDRSAEFAGAAFVFTRGGNSWSQTAYFKASNATSYDFFGDQVALDGTRVLVSAAWEASSARGYGGDESDNRAVNAGALYLFTPAGNGWQQLAYIKASNADADHYFSVTAIDGDTLAMGAPGETSNATGINGDQNHTTSYRAGAAYVLR